MLLESFRRMIGLILYSRDSGILHQMEEIVTNSMKNLLHTLRKVI